MPRSRKKGPNWQSKLAEVFPIKKSEVTASTEFPEGERYSRLDFLLRWGSLKDENYPLPVAMNQVTETAMRKHILFKATAKFYPLAKVSSKMMAIDCERCGTTTDPNALTWIAIVNEDLETVYETLVKPPDPIIDYRSHLSGVTEERMKNVRVTLKDVQNRIQQLVAENPDCILLGHSLNHDLKAVRMTHPYVIDTSVIFRKNSKRPSLRNLVSKSLKCNFQSDDAAHSPVEDAIAVMKIVKQVLKEGPAFVNEIKTELEMAV